MSPRTKTPTMREVAELAGVSIQTISAVINGKPGITEGTKTRVLAAIEQLGYRPYSVARSLRTRQTHTIAMFVPDIANPSFAAMASAAEDGAHDAGYNLALYNTHDDVEREARYIRMATERWVDGVLFVSARDHADSLEALRLAGIPSVTIDRIPDGYAGPSVTLDNVAAGRMATEHLLDLGHTLIAHITGPLDLKLARERYMGFRQAIESRGLTPGPCVTGERGWECQAGQQAMRMLLQRRPLPTAVFVANDRQAIGAMHAIREAGLQVPEDISVIGLDDIEVSPFQAPPLTTVRQSFSQIAVHGIQILLDILAGKTPDRLQQMIQPTLVVRRSTAPPHNH